MQDTNFDSYDWSGFGYPKQYMQALFEFAKERQFKWGLEIGFDQGASTIALLRGSPEARLLSVDIAPCTPANEMIVASDVADRSTFVQVDSREWMPNMRESFAEGADELGINGFDFIYIDGDHLYDAVRQDLFNADTLLLPGGVIIADDADPNHTLFGVHQAVNEFCAEKGYSREPLHLTTSFQVVLRRI